MDATQNLNVGLLHPGAMGSTVGAAALPCVRQVLWASEGRSPASRRRAEEAGLSDAKSLENLVREVDLLVAVCPPAAALALAERVATLRYRGLFVDANAVSPDSARQIAAVVARGGASAVDGGIIGPPARRAGTTTLHLSGERASEVASCFAKGPLEARVLDRPIGAASALKMTFAAYTKGTAALLAAIHALALAEGVEGELAREWERLLPELPGRLRGLPTTAPKAWRFVAEMREIAASLESAGLPGGFHDAAAQIYERLEGFKDAPELPSLAAMAAALRQRSS